MTEKTSKSNDKGTLGSTNRILITGGCGFIGSNLAEYYLEKGWDVIIYDNLSRQGSEVNAAWLADQGDGRFELVHADVRDMRTLLEAMQGVDVVAHLAAQVAVTKSVRDPLDDFLINALGGLHVLEAARKCGSDPIVLYASTNKVYGGMEDLQTTNSRLRYSLEDYPNGISETFPIDLHSPYGCSKGSCDQYMLDYSRIFGLRTVVFRQSCIYGPRQFGIEDQGWVAHFVISAMLDRPITIYGDGRQARDVLHVTDLVELFDMAVENIDICAGQAYNIGGGPRNATSLLELIYRLEPIMDRAIPLQFGDWRPGDQRVYVSDIRKAERDLGWTPTIALGEGLQDLCEWVASNKGLFQSLPGEREPVMLHDQYPPTMRVGA
jgi:CDP-paratose 2-epimerase